MVIKKISKTIMIRHLIKGENLSIMNMIADNIVLSINYDLNF